VIEEGITFRDGVVLNMIHLKAMMQLVFIAAINGSDKEKFQVFQWSRVNHINNGNQKMQSEIESVILLSILFSFVNF